MSQELNDPYGLDLLGDLFSHPTETEEPIINDGELSEENPRPPRPLDQSTVKIR